MNEMHTHLHSFTAYLSAPRMRAKEQAHLVKRLSFLIRSGMPVTESLALIGSQSPKRVRIALKEIEEDVEAGKSLADSARRFPRLFNEFGITVIEVGESSGTLADNLEYLSNELRTAARLRAKLIGALIYPALITLATVALTASLILFIFPKIMPIFSGLDVTLPFSTRLILFLNAFLRQWGVALVILIGIACIAFSIARKRSERVRSAVAQFLLSFPILGTLLKSYYLANSTRTLSLLLRSGMTIRDALPATARATIHPLYRREFVMLSESLEEGADFSAYLRTRRTLFPDLLTQMVSVGESSGTLAETLSYISDYYESEAEELIQRLSTLIEPVLMVIMGGIVGFVAVSMITPIYEITQHLHAQ